jgi:hypothetical protein
LEISVLANMNLHLPAIKLLANAISVLYVHISQGEEKKKKVLHLESGNVATKQNCLSVI